MESLEKHETLPSSIQITANQSISAFSLLVLNIEGIGKAVCKVVRNSEVVPCGSRKRIAQLYLFFAKQSGSY